MNTLKMLLAACTFLVASNACAGPVQTFLSIQSDAGDVVGKGQSYYHTPSIYERWILNTYIHGNGINLLMDTTAAQPNPPPGWFANFSTAGPLAIGQYDHATSPTTANSPQPQIYVAYGYAKPSSATGSFHIYDLGYNKYGNFDHLALTFEQYSNGSTAALHGMLWYNSSFPLSAVPEPQVYAQLLIGLGLVGACIRRRKGTAAIPPAFTA